MPMKAVITGGTGLVGQVLQEVLLIKGYEVCVFTRSPKTFNEGDKLRYASWPMNEEGLGLVRDADVVFNLAGAPVAQRWTNAAKQAILNSRVDTTDVLVEAMKGSKPKTLVSASAIGIYPEGEERMSEQTEPDSGFLSEVVQAWETSALRADADGHRVVCLRIGLVLSADGGALGKLLPLFKLGLGSAVGTGNHWQSWIHVKDLADLFAYAGETTTMQGVYNAVAPNPVSNKELSRSMAKALKKPFFLPPVPGFVLRLVFGEMAQVILASQRVSSDRTELSGFRFTYPELDAAMKDLFAS